MTRQRQGTLLWYAWGAWDLTVQLFSSIRLIYEFRLNVFLSTLNESRKKLGASFPTPGPPSHDAAHGNLSCGCELVSILAVGKIVTASEVENVSLETGRDGTRRDVTETVISLKLPQKPPCLENRLLENCKRTLH